MYWSSIDEKQETPDIPWHLDHDSIQSCKRKSPTLRSGQEQSNPICASTRISVKAPSSPSMCVNFEGVNRIWIHDSVTDRWVLMSNESKMTTRVVHPYLSERYVDTRDTQTLKPVVSCVRHQFDLCVGECSSKRLRWTGGSMFELRDR
jgi:hypothetical protein